MSSNGKLLSILPVLFLLSMNLVSRASNPVNPTDPGVRYWGTMYVEKNGDYVEVKKIEIPASYLPNGLAGIEQSLNQATMAQLFDLEQYEANHPQQEGAQYRFHVLAQPDGESPCVTCNATTYCTISSPAITGSGQCNYSNWCVIYDPRTTGCPYGSAWACATAGLVAKAMTQVGTLTDTDITSNPIAIRANLYAGSAGCTVTSNGKALIVNPAKTALAGKRAGITRAYYKPVTLCTENCTKTGQWAITPVTQDKTSDGFKICMSGSSTECLAWNEKDGLTLVTTTKATEPTQADKDAMTWYPGAGEIKDGAVTGYQILAKTSIDHALVVDKATGAVSVEKAYTLKAGNTTDLPQYTPDTKFDPVWKFSDCKALMPAKPAKKVAPKTSKN